MEMIIMFRIIRVFNLMNELTSFRLIGDTFKALIMPFWTLIMVLFCVYYIWAMIGDRAFGGLVFHNNIQFETASGPPSFFVWMNYNDLVASFF